MSSGPATDRPPQPLTRAFPEGGPLIRLAYRELDIAANGNAEQVKALGDLRLLPRPWDPPSCREPALRAEIWAWLEQVVSWLNAEYVWDLYSAIPSCWPQHPHLVHEIAVVADQRRRANIALTSDALEDWHRYCLPTFTDRMNTRTKDHCEQGHQRWPASSRYARYTSDTSQRADAFSRDVDSTRPAPTEHSSARPRLAVVDTNTWEIIDEPP